MLGAAARPFTCGADILPPEEALTPYVPFPFLASKPTPVYLHTHVMLTLSNVSAPLAQIIHVFFIYLFLLLTRSSRSVASHTSLSLSYTFPATSPRNHPLSAAGSPAETMRDAAGSRRGAANWLASCCGCQRRNCTAHAPQPLSQGARS